MDVLGEQRSDASVEDGVVSSPQLIGREAELERLSELVDRVHEQGGALVVRGEAGVGKSALLAAASAQACQQGLTVVIGTGVESEKRLSFSALHKLLLPFLDRLDRLSDSQRHALEMALGVRPREAAPDGFLIGLAALGLIADAAAEAPLLFVVEDAQWIDRSSGMVLGFVARRLEMEPALMWFAVRSGLVSEVDDSGISEIELAGLGTQDSSRLLELRGSDLPADVKMRILDQAVGNPLALIELPEAAKNHALNTHSLQLTARLEQAFAARLDDLAAAQRALLLVAALDDGETSLLLQAATTVLGTPLDVHAWEPIVAAGFGRRTPDGFRFRHPLIRSAVEQAAPVEERRAAHAALADLLTDDLDRAIWHRAAATGGHDEAVATALSDAAGRAWARGASDVAIAALERSAGLTSDPGVRALRLWHAATLGLQLGRWLGAGRLFAEAQRLGLPPYEDASATLSLQFLAGTMSSGGAIVRTFVDVAEGLLAEGDQQRGLQALEAVATRAYWGNLEDETKRRASRVAQKFDVPRNEPRRLAFLANVDPIRNGREILNQLSQISPSGVGESHALVAIGQAAAAVWADDAGIPFLRAAGDRLRAEGKLAPLLVVLATEAWAYLHRGAVVPGLTAAAEAGRLATETGRVLYLPAAKLAESVATAQRGRDEDSRASIAEAEAILLPLGATPLLAMVALARGRAQLAAGHYSDAYERLGRLFDPNDVMFHPFLRGHALADLVDAAKGGNGDLDLVRRYLDEWREIAANTTSPYLKAQLSYAAAVLSKDEDADDLFQVAIVSAKGWEFFAARAYYAYGVWLRRVKRATDARAPLREAAEIFNALGQVTYAQRALAELRASGETVRRRVPEAWAELTPQELQIAQLAAEGLSNKEIGERLYISPRTAGNHLYHLFPKLGITSRSQLRDALKPTGLS